MGRRLRVGVLGLGLMGMRHAKILAARHDADLCGGADVNEAARVRFQGTFAVAAFSDLGELLATSPDAVIVCLPDNTHRDVVCDALEAGNHVLVEKPLATDVTDARQMVATAAAGNKNLMVGFTLRFDPRYRAAAAAVHSQRIGQVSLIHARRNSALGAAQRYGATTSLPWHVTIHDIDSVLAITRQRVREVTARATSHRLGPVGHVDALGALMVLEGDVPVVVESSWVLPTTMQAAIDSRLEVVGTHGVVEVSGFDEGLRVVDEQGFDFPDVIRYCDDAGSGPGGALYHEVGHFLDVCREVAPPEASLADAVHSVEVVAAIEESIAERSTVLVGSET